MRKVKNLKPVVCGALAVVLLFSTTGCSLFSSKEKQIEAILEEKESQTAHTEQVAPDHGIYEPGDTEEVVQEIEPEQVEDIILEDFAMTVGSTVALTTQNLGYSEEQAVTWRSNHSDLAFVEGNELTALAVGTVQIMARLEKRSGYCTVEIVEPLSSLELDETTLELELGDSYTLEAEAEWNLEAQTLEWTSSNENVATVDHGKITTHSVGSAVITAGCGEVRVSCNLEVYAPTEEQVVAEPEEKPTQSTESMSSGNAEYLVYRNENLDLTCPYPSDFIEAGTDEDGVLQRYINPASDHEIEIGFDAANGQNGEAALNQYIAENSDCVVTYSASGESWYAISMCSNTQIMYRKAKIKDGIVAWFEYNIPVDNTDTSYNAHITYMEANFAFKK